MTSQHPEQSQTIEKKPRKRRSQEEKVGRRKYIIQLIHGLEGKIDRIDQRTRTLMAGLGDLLMIKTDYLTLVTCQDEVDQEILNFLFYAGTQGLSTGEIADKLAAYHIDRFNVLRRLKRMNKKLRRELNQNLVGRRGWRYALTNYVFKIFELTKEEISTAVEIETEEKGEEEF